MNYEKNNGSKINQNNLAYFNMGRPGNNYDQSTYGAAQMDPKVLLGYTMGMMAAYDDVLERLGLPGLMKRREASLYGIMRQYPGSGGTMSPPRSNVVDITDRFTTSAAPKESTTSTSKAA
jgi:hypothetical protein